MNHPRKLAGVVEVCNETLVKNLSRELRTSVKVTFYLRCVYLSQQGLCSCVFFVLKRIHHHLDKLKDIINGVSSLVSLQPYSSNRSLHVSPQCLLDCHFQLKIRY